MSVVGLGDKAVAGEIDAGVARSEVQNVKYGGEISTAGALPVKGVYFINPPANPTAYTLADGERSGDIVKFIHRGGANVANISVPSLHGVGNTIDMTGGASFELVWSLNGDWYMVGRNNGSVAGATAVVALPAIS